MFHRRRQVIQELSKVSSQRLRRDEREPQYGKIEEQAERDSARLRLGWLSQLSITLSITSCLNEITERRKTQRPA